jgi:hypothetical protein
MARTMLVATHMTRLAFGFASLLAAGCLHAQPVVYSGPVDVASAELVSINPDVKVVADSDKPMFFAVGSYWMFHDGAWYRSNAIRGEWIKDTHPPVPVVQIDQPFAFTHYRNDHPIERTATAEATATPPSSSTPPDFKFPSNNLLGF